MKLSIIGSGYVGLVTGACFAELGHEVLCIDNNSQKIEQLNSGHIPIYEPGLQELVETNSNEGRLHFSTSIVDGVDFADVIFICVGTPPLPSGEADLSAVEKVIQIVAQNMKTYKVVVEKSTVPVQTAEWLDSLARKHFTKQDIPFDLASNPEFLSEGTAIKDFMNPDRVVLGVNSDRAASLLVQLYAPLNAPLLITDINSAELIKHASNAFLAMKISFVNALANICESTGADINKVAKGIGLDERIGSKFLRAGIGYGGSCFPKDVAAFIKIVEKNGYDFELLKSVEKINQTQRLHVINKIKRALSNNLSNRDIAILGLAYKPNTDDLRDAPAITVIDHLLEAGANVRAYDPIAMENAKSVLSDRNITYGDDIFSTCQNADAVVIITEWPVFKSINLIKLKESLKQAIIIDGRNIFDPKKLERLGFYYDSIGRHLVN